MASLFIIKNICLVNTVMKRMPLVYIQSEHNFILFGFWSLKTFTWFLLSIIHSPRIDGVQVIVLLPVVNMKSTVFTTSTLCSIQTKAQFTILKWLPSDLLLKQTQQIAAERLTNAGLWPGANHEHVAFLGRHRHVRIDNMLPYNFLVRTLSFFYI